MELQLWQLLVTVGLANGAAIYAIIRQNNRFMDYVLNGKPEAGNPHKANGPSLRQLADGQDEMKKKLDALHDKVADNRQLIVTRPCVLKLMAEGMDDECQSE